MTCLLFGRGGRVALELVRARCWLLEVVRFSLAAQNSCLFCARAVKIGAFSSGAGRQRLFPHADAQRFHNRPARSTTCVPLYIVVDERIVACYTHLFTHRVSGGEHAGTEQK